MNIDYYTELEFQGLVDVLSQLSIKIERRPQILSGIFNPQAGFLITDLYTLNEYVYVVESVAPIFKFIDIHGKIRYYEAVIFAVELPFDKIPLYLNRGSNIISEVLAHRLKISK